MPDAINPYIAGSPITGSEMFFGREDVFEFVKRTLSGKHRDNVIVLYGQRRTGKTSVLYHISQHLDPNYLCVFVDLHALQLNGLNVFLWELANYIVRGLRRDHGIDVLIPNRTEFMVDARDCFRNEFLAAARAAIGSRHLLLMLDEVGRLHEKIQANELEAGVFEYLRHLMQHYDWLNFLFSLGSSLEEMEQEYSLLFSVALYRRISFLSQDAATQLITNPVQNQYRVQPAAVARILEITSGHPYYTQLLCHCLFARWQQEPRDSIGVRDVEQVLEFAIELGSANLKFVWEQSNPGEKAVMAGLAANTPGRMQVSDLQAAWSALDVFLPRAEVAKAMRSLIARDLVTGDDQFRFTVDLQRLWIKQQRRLDWVKEEIASALPEWSAVEATEPKKVQKWWKSRLARRVGFVLASAILLSGAGTFAWYRYNQYIYNKKPVIPRSAAPGFASFMGSIRALGATEHFNLYADAGLSKSAIAVPVILQKAEEDYKALSGYYGVQAPHFNILVFALGGATDGTGGADHIACDATNIEVDLAVSNPDLTSALLAVEQAEVFQTIRTKRQNACGTSNGEGLARALGEALHPGALAGFATGPAWAQGGYPDFISQTDPTQMNAESTGATVVFYNWLRYGLGYRWEQICQADGRTPAETYSKLKNGKGSAFFDFMNAIRALPNGVKSDNPFLRKGAK